MQRPGFADEKQGHPGSNAGWRLPSFSFDSWCVARGIPGTHRGGFRAWITQDDGGGQRDLAVWDNDYRRYLAAEVG